MITFYQTEGKATVVWDGERDCALCEFEGRQFTTDDDNIITKLRALGYPEKHHPQNYKEAEQMAQIDQINEGRDTGDSPQDIAQKAAEKAQGETGPPPVAQGPAKKAAKPARSAKPARAAKK